MLIKSLQVLVLPIHHKGWTGCKNSGLLAPQTPQKIISFCETGCYKKKRGIFCCFEVLRQVLKWKKSHVDPVRFLCVYNTCAKLCIKILPKFKYTNRQTHKCINAYMFLVCLMSANFKELCGTWTHSQSTILLLPFIKMHLQKILCICKFKAG